MFRNPFSFNGRIRRTEYGYSLLIFFALVIPIEMIVDYGASTLLFLSYIPAIWFMLAQGSKRCHDRGYSGFWQLIPFYVIWMVFADGEPGTNEFGVDPKGRKSTVRQLLRKHQVA